MAENQTQEPSLEELTNQTFGEDFQTPQGEVQTEVEVESKPQEGTVVEGTAPKEATATPTDGKAYPDELKNAFEETPFKGEDVVKSVQDVVKSWKSSDAGYKKLESQVKPLMHIIEKANQNPQLKAFLDQALQVFENPQLANAYVNQNGQVDAVPDPHKYNVADPNTGEVYWNKAEYDKDHANWVQRQVDSRISARMSQVEQNAKLEQHKYGFKQKYPDVQEDPDRLLADVSAEWNRLNPIEVAWKIKNYDNLQSQALEKARKELTNDIKKAEQGTPQSASAPKQKVSVSDIITHINRYGSESAKKRFGGDAYKQALQSSAEQY